MKTVNKIALAGVALAGMAVLSPLAKADATGYCIIPAWKMEKAEEPEIVVEKILHTELLHIVGFAPTMAQQTQESTKPYTDAELEMLACVIYQEAGGDSASDETRRMVGEVVLNRVNDPRFPDSIEAVLTQRAQYGRFYWTGIIWPARAKNEPEAVERAYDCAKAVFEEERLLPNDVVFEAEFPQGKECVVHVPGYYFCR